MDEHVYIYLFGEDGNENILFGFELLDAVQPICQDVHP
jgi:hypothetical protein